MRAVRDILAQFPGIQSLSMLLRIYKLPLVGMPGTAHEQIALRAKQPFLTEGFADRAYDADGRLRPRTEPGAVLTDRREIIDKVMKLTETVSTICIHGDSEGCVEIAAYVHEALSRAGFRLGV